MHVLVTHKNEEDQIKNEGARVATTFLTLKNGNYSKRSMAANSTVPSESWAKLKLIQAFMIVLITCKNEEDPIKNVSARVLITLKIDFQMLKGS